jgi:hypothetical protein
MKHRSGSMKIMSSKCFLAQPMVTTCGHMEEGPSADELHLRILGITSRSVETLDHTNDKNTEKVNCRCNWWSLPVVT